jgi:AcrR family transcriptional regulator
VLQKGRKRVEGILEAARQIIVLDGYGNFTMRRVASKAGISLGNLQHYFVDKAALLRELLRYLNRRYDEDYSALAAASGGDRVKRFYAFIDYLLTDARNPLVRGLYLQFWALSSNDAYIAKCMEDTYAHYRRALITSLKAVNPKLAGIELRLRAAIVQSMVEGCQFALVNQHGVLVPPRGLHERIRNEALRIALRPIRGGVVEPITPRADKRGRIGSSLKRGATVNHVR